MTVACAWLRLYACIVADTQEEFEKAYSYGTCNHNTSGLYAYVSGKRDKWQKSYYVKKKDRK